MVWVLLLLDGGHGGLWLLLIADLVVGQVWRLHALRSLIPLDHWGLLLLVVGSSRFGLCDLSRLTSLFGEVLLVEVLELVELNLASFVQLLSLGLLLSLCLGNCLRVGVVLLTRLEQDPLLLALVRLLAVLHRAGELVHLVLGGAQLWLRVWALLVRWGASRAFGARFSDFLLVCGVVAVDQVLDGGVALLLLLLVHCVVDGEALIATADLQRALHWRRVVTRGHYLIA